MKCIIYLSLVAATAIAAPQTISTHSSQTLRSALGRGSVTSSLKTVDTPHSHTHGHETRVNNDPVVQLVSHPRVVQQLSSGPFIVRDSGNGPFLIDDSAIQSPFVDAPLRSAALLPAPANPAGHSLFQTADGRFFALSTASNTIQPGQIFRTSDGRIFTTAVAAATEKEQSGSLFDQENDDGASTVIETSRDIQRNRGNAAQAEEEQEEQAEEVATTVEEEAEEVEEPVTKAPAVNKATKKVKTVTRVRNNAGATLTPASTSLLAAANPGIFRSVAAVPSLRQEIVAAGPHLTVGQAPLRTAILQRGPLTYSLAGEVSSGFYSYPGLGVAYEF